MKCIGMKINLTDQLSNFGIIPGYLKVFDFIEETNDLVSGKPEAKTGNIWETRLLWSEKRTDLDGAKPGCRDKNASGMLRKRRTL